GHGAANGANLVVREWRGAPDAVLEVAALDELHDDERRSRLGLFADVVDRDDVRMAQPGRRARFTSESLEEFGFVGKLRVEGFHRDVGVGKPALCFQDYGHATTSDFSDEPIAPAEHAVGALQAHRRPTSSSGSSST